MESASRVPVTVAGPYQGFPLYEPVLYNVPQGQRVSLRADVLIHNPGGHVCQTNIGRTLFVLDADIPQKVREVSVLLGLVHRDQRGTVIKADQNAKVLHLGVVTHKSIYQLKEVCAGIGGLGVGAEASGFRTTASVEKQTTFCQVLKQLVTAAVIEGDMGLLDTIERLHLADPEPSSLGFGFNCQSFSRPGGGDERSMTLPDSS